MNECPLSCEPDRVDRRDRVWLGVLVVAWGVQAIVTQSLLLREALVLMFGSYFAWGVVRFAWILGVGGGAAMGGWAAQRISRPDVGLVAVLVALSVAACIELWVFRGARMWLGVEPGELLPLPKIIIAAVLFVSPCSAPVGMAFPLACCVTSLATPQASVCADSPRGLKPAACQLLQLGSVYALESAGSLIGGALFTFWAVEHLTPIQTALTCGAVTAAASAGLLFVTARRSYGAVCLVVVSMGALMTSILAGDALDRRLVQRRWQSVAPGYELCAEAESKYQNLAVGRRAEQFTLYSDGQVSADFPDPYTFVPLAHFWMCQHPSPRRVLVLGGGAEGLLAVILRHPIEHVDYVENDPRQIDLIEPYLTDADRSALNDPRVTVHNVDPRYFVKTQSDQFDLVIARLPEPMSAQRARLYTVEFFRELRRAMTSKSVLCITAAATPGFLTTTSAEYLASIRATIRNHFPHVTVGWGNPAQILVATQEGLVTTDPGILMERYSERGVQSEWFHPAWFDGATDWLDPDKLRQRAAQLDATDHVEISTDLRPVVYVQRLTLWESATGKTRGGSRGVIERLRSVRWRELIMILVVLAGVLLLASYLQARPSRHILRANGDAQSRAAWLLRSAIILAIATTGFVTMALSIIWLFAFQNLYGYVYQRIGWIIAIFMGGLVLGCWWFSWRCRRLSVTGKHRIYLWSRLIAVDVLLALLALAVPWVLPALGGLQSGPLTLTLVEWCVSILVALTGVLGGATFALAGFLQIDLTGRIGSAAGTIDSADHAGACLGALLCGILLVPVFGTAAAALLLAGIKLSSAALLVVGWRFSRLV